MPDERIPADCTCTIRRVLADPSPTDGLGDRPLSPAVIRERVRDPGCPLHGTRGEGELCVKCRRNRVIGATGDPICFDCTISARPWWDASAPHPASQELGEREALAAWCEEQARCQRQDAEEIASSDNTDTDAEAESRRRTAALIREDADRFARIAALLRPAAPASEGEANAPIRVRHPYAPDLVALRREVESEVPEQYHAAIRRWFQWWGAAQYAEVTVYNETNAPANTASAGAI